ncbi:Fe-S cluster assembly scaffold protein NifU [Sinanaerobacter sp. ZZT-01]|uniref:Fe-S cluster assembly scaffold protein NifU n=1 Tax=Sinanaerobacter sp. ZZT-01 TaxID=3111540 RepID=UPI002D7673DF|nr:Fe-S cluster assembly scaffold protein NifU [Sinanaerobacter sp. ZZT-01]WRR95112.1 Fe-S cluster assembly scaffold protein NifU [Sinanaerobacter sp. ZZT-01]
MYNDKVMDLFMNPQNVGEIEDADGIGTYGSPICGDMMKISLKVENNVIVDAKFKTFGCGSAIASSSMATEMIIGKTIEEALDVTNKDVLKELGGLPGPKIHCSVLSEQAIKAAIYDYAQKNGLEFEGLKDYDPNASEDEHLHEQDEEDGE